MCKLWINLLKGKPEILVPPCLPGHHLLLPFRGMDLSQPQLVCRVVFGLESAHLFKYQMGRF